MKNLGIIIGLIFIVVVGYIVYARYFSIPEKRHVHAGFLVFVDGKKQDFSGVRYMSLEPCDEDDSHLTRQEIQHEKAHLHDNIGFVAHSHLAGATWGDLFKNIKYKFDSSKTITAYVNGETVGDIFSYPLNAYDSVVIFVGAVDKKLLSQVISNKQIEKIEQTSADCGVDQ